MNKAWGAKVWSFAHSVCVNAYFHNRTYLAKSGDLSTMCSNSAKDRAPSSSRSASSSMFWMRCCMSSSDNRWGPVSRSITCLRSPTPSISSPSKSAQDKIDRNIILYCLHNNFNLVILNFIMLILWWPVVLKHLH